MVGDHDVRHGVRGWAGCCSLLSLCPMITGMVIGLVLSWLLFWVVLGVWVGGMVWFGIESDLSRGLVWVCGLCWG